MAIKTFTTGEVLTAADTNTYLNNAGLVLISTTTIGTAVSTIPVTSCFSSTYDRYKIVMSGTKNSASGGTQGIIFTPNVTNTGNYSSVMWQVATSATVNTANSPNQTYYFVGIAGNNQVMVDIDNFTPAGAIGSTGSIRWSSYDGTNSTGGTGAMWSVNTGTNTGFTIGVGGGLTFTGGTVAVYGYRKP